jgi:hypothetical protein
MASLLDIQHLILFTNDFIVFIDSKLDVDWKTSDEYDQKEHEKSEGRTWIAIPLRSIATSEPWRWAIEYFRNFVILRNTDAIQSGFGRI